MNTHRLTDGLTSLAARSFPRSRRVDGIVVRDCAREAIDASGPTALPGECLSLAAAGLRIRAGATAHDLRVAPWRDGLVVLTLPLSATILAVWTFGFVPRYGHWPLGEGWALLLVGSVMAVVGAALQERHLLLIGALATFVAAVSPHLGFGVESISGLTPTFFRGWDLDLPAASLLPTLLLVAGAFSLPSRSSRSMLSTSARLAVGFVPAVAALAFLWPPPQAEPSYTNLVEPGVADRVVAAPPHPMPWLWPSRTLELALAIALGAAFLITWIRARKHAAGAVASGLLLASVAYPVAWVAIDNSPSPYWLYNGAYPLLLATLPLLLGLTLMRRAGSGQSTSKTR